MAQLTRTFLLELGIVSGVFLLFVFWPLTFQKAWPDIIATFVGVFSGYIIAVNREERIRKKENNLIRARALIEKEKNRVYVFKTLQKELEYNQEMISYLSSIEPSDIPNEFLRMSAWKTISSNYLSDVDDLKLIQKLHELFFEFELLNTNLDYIRRKHFFSVPDHIVTDRGRVLLYHEVRIASKELAQRIREILPELVGYDD